MADPEVIVIVTPFAAGDGRYTAGDVTYPRRWLIGPSDDGHASA